MVIVVALVVLLLRPNGVESQKPKEIGEIWALSHELQIPPCIANWFWRIWQRHHIERKGFPGCNRSSESVLVGRRIFALCSAWKMVNRQLQSHQPFHSHCSQGCSSTSFSGNSNISKPFLSSIGIHHHRMRWSQRSISLRALSCWSCVRLWHPQHHILFVSVIIIVCLSLLPITESRGHTHCLKIRFLLLRVFLIKF